MGVSYNPKTVTNGLVLALDAGNVKSYPGSGNNWTDMSGLGNNGTLTNGPTFSNGSLVFDGADDYVNCGTSSVSFTGNISVFAWIYPTTFKSIFTLIATKWFNPDGLDFHFSLKSDVGNGTNIRQNLFTTSNSDLYGSTTFSINNWYYVGFTLVNGGLLTFYKNGIADGTSSGVSRAPQSSSLQIADARGSLYNFTGRIPQVSMYNRTLSAAEVSQNFNALRGRYGI